MKHNQTKIETEVHLYQNRKEYFKMSLIQSQAGYMHRIIGYDQTDERILVRYEKELI